MSNFGCYINVNSNAEKLNKLTPELLYYKMTSKSRSGLAYISLRLCNCKNKKTILDALFHIGKYNIYTMELYHIYFLSARSYFYNDPFLLEYMTKLVDHGMKFPASYLLSYLGDYCSNEYIFQYNTLLFNSGIDYDISSPHFEQKQLNLNKITSQIYGVYSNGMPNDIQRTFNINYHCKNRIKSLLNYLNKTKWEHPSIYVLYELQMLVDIYKLSSDEDIGYIVEKMKNAIGYNTHINRQATSLHYYHVYKNKVNLSNFIVNLSSNNNEYVLLSKTHILTILRKFICYLCKNINETLSYGFMNDHLTKQLFSTPKRNPESSKVNIDNYLYGHKYAIEYDDIIQIPFKKHRIDEPEKNDNKNEYFYGGIDSYR